MGRERGSRGPGVHHDQNHCREAAIHSEDAWVATVNDSLTTRLHRRDRLLTTTVPVTLGGRSTSTDPVMKLRDSDQPAGLPTVTAGSATTQFSECVIVKLLITRGIKHLHTAAIPTYKSAAIAGLESSDCRYLG